MKLSEIKFSDLDLPEQLMRGVDDCGFEYLTEVQAKSIPKTLEGKDLAVQAQTGSGKTAAFLITIFKHIMEKPKRQTTNVCPRAIVITPTRELAVQVASDARKLGAHLDMRILLAYGGVDYDKQRKDISKGVDLLVGTPGRLIDYLKQRVYHLKDVEIAVIDEADRMFDMGFIADIRFLMRRMSDFDKRQSILYSATLGQRVMELSYEYMNTPELVEVSPDTVVADNVEQVLYHLGSKEKLAYLMGLLETEEWKKALIFVNTKHMANRLKEVLNHNGYPAAVLSGDIAQDKRQKVLQRFKGDDLKILVATDVASRGLHVEGITHVFNYDLPQDTEDYVHRIGRTARAGASGKAITFACEDYVFTLPEIEDFIGHSIPTEPPDNELFKEPKMPPRKPYKPSNKPGGNRPGQRGRGPGSQRSGSNKGRRTGRPSGKR